jgi:hypothetical protein
MDANFKALQFLFFGHSSEDHGEQPQPRKSKTARLGLRKICLRYYQSSEFPSRVLRSSRMHIQTKLVILKFLRRIEQKAMVDLG